MQRFMQARIQALAAGTAGMKQFRCEVPATVAVGAPVGEIWIYDFIDPWGVSAVDIVQALQAIGPGDVLVHVNSPGGDVFEGIAIYNNLKAHPGNVTVRVEGVAASAASFIAMAGATIEVDPNAMIMIHDAAGMEFGNAAILHKFADLLDRTSTNLANIYAARTGRPADEMRAAMLEETWYVGQEGVDAGLADTVTAAGAVTPGFSNRVDLSLYNRAPTGARIPPVAVPALPAVVDTIVVPDTIDDIDFDVFRQAFREARA